MSDGYDSLFTIYYQNTRGLRSKTHTFLASAWELLFDIIVVTESWLDDSIANTELLPPSYSVVRCDRKFSLTNRSAGGGVFVALSDGINYEICDVSVMGSIVPLVDIVACRCYFRNAYVYIVAVYIPPDIPSEDFELFSEALEIFLIDKPNILLGDFNVPNFTRNDISCTKSTIFRLICNSLNLRQFNQVTNCNNRLLDLVLSNVVGEICVEREQLPFVPLDPCHPALNISVCLPHATAYSKFPSNCNVRYNFRKANWQKLFADISLVDWTSLQDITNSNIAVESFYNVLYDLFDLSVPKVTSVARRSYPVWFTSTVIANLKLKLYYRKKWKDTKQQAFLDEFRRLRHLCKLQISNCYESYLNRVESSILRDPREVFRYVRERSGTTRIPSALFDGGARIDTPQRIVNAFADLFSSMYQPSLSYSSPDTRSNQLPFVLPPVTEEEVMNIMSTFPLDFTAGDDLVPCTLINGGRFALSKPLAAIINLAIKTSDFPIRWKRARITPVFKKGDRTRIQNYRPISVLPNFGKIFESVIYSCIYHNTKPFISSYQHGFVPGRSTTTNLVSVTQNICQVLDAGGQLDVIYTDFSRAFDTIDHGVLLAKLSSFGLSPSLLRLLYSYLADRRAYVFYNGFKSKEFCPLSGVPQGSNLGPLLFILYINDLLGLLNCSVLAYADDLKIFAPIASWNDVVCLQADLNLLVDWCFRFRLKLNVGKCGYVSFTRKVNYISSSYSINNVALTKTNNIKDLGILFDSRLSFADHINSICTAASRALGFVMRSCKQFESLALLKTLYFSFVVSKLEYASQVWSPSYVYLQLGVEKIQRRFLKYLCYKSTGSYPQRGVDYVLLLEMHGLDSLASRREAHGARFVWKLVNGYIDSPFLLSCLDFFTPRLSCRSSPTFLLPFSRTNLLQASPLVIMCRAANLHYDDIFLNNINNFRQ